MNGLIDPPSPFAPVQEWKEFLAQMKALNSNDPEIKKAIRDAEARIAERMVYGV